MKEARRSFLVTAGATTVAALASPGLAQTTAPALQRKPMPIELPKLPFEDKRPGPDDFIEHHRIPLRQTPQGLRRQPEQGHRRHRPG
jgi:hypothetical protein